MGKRKRILVVEDDPVIVRGLRELLRSEDYTVESVASGTRGLDKMLASHPDLVLLDVNLPAVGGLEICRQARAGGFTNPVLMLTARVDQADKISGLEAGADDYITKPFDGRELLARIRAQLRISSRRASPLVVNHAGPGSGNRRLLCIMFTDMKDFSRTMNRDEQLGLKLLKRQNNTITRLVTKYGGRIVEVIGDAFLIAFDSAVVGSECGVSIQRAFMKYNGLRPPREQIHVRMGIHLGDVMEVEGKLRGDTVNVAARLQQLGHPDHITVSAGVYDALKGRLDAHVRKLGLRRVKNIRQPVTVYQITV